MKPNPELSCDKAGMGAFIAFTDSDSFKAGMRAFIAFTDSDSFKAGMRAFIAFTDSDSFKAGMRAFVTFTDSDSFKAGMRAFIAFTDMTISIGFARSLLLWARLRLWIMQKIRLAAKSALILSIQGS